MAIVSDLNGTRHTIRVSHAQSMPAATEPAAQDHTFVQHQFDRSISSLLVLSGFTSVTAPALHSLKALAEEFIVEFLETVCTSMITSRRTTALPQDFILALAEQGITASDFEAQLHIKVPRSISCPTIAAPAPGEQPAPELSALLGSELIQPSTARSAEIPPHFPPLPSAHAWKASEQVTAREKDLRRLRERATQEGVLAEQALRRLATAAKKPRSRTAGVDDAAAKKKEMIWQEALYAVMGGAAEGGQGDVDMADAAEAEKRAAMVINYDRAYWRKGMAFGT